MNLKRFSLFLTVTAYAVGSVPAHAAGELVYAARYFLKPGNRGKSYFHLHRINVNGSGRKQLTSGPYNDDKPQWSPDGRHILFERDKLDGSVGISVVSAKGGPVRNIVDVGFIDHSQIGWTPGGYISLIHSDAKSNFGSSAFYIFDLKGNAVFRLYGPSEYAWSPDGLHLALQYENSKTPVKIMNWKTRRTINIDTPVFRMIWRDTNTLLCTKEMRFESKSEFREYGVDGKLKRVTPVVFSDDYSGSFTGIKAAPGNAASLFLVCDESTSSGAQYAYIPYKPGQTVDKPLCEGNSLSFSTDGKNFVFAPYHQLKPYSGKKVVYTAPLELGSTKGGKSRSLVSGMVYVSACDWLKKSDSRGL